MIFLCRWVEIHHWCFSQTSSFLDWLSHGNSFDGRSFFKKSQIGLQPSLGFQISNRSFGTRLWNTGDFSISSILVYNFKISLLTSTYKLCILYFCFIWLSWFWNIWCQLLAFKLERNGIPNINFEHSITKIKPLELSEFFIINRYQRASSWFKVWKHTTFDIVTPFETENTRF